MPFANIYTGQKCQKYLIHIGQRDQKAFFRMEKWRLPYSAWHLQHISACYIWLSRSYPQMAPPLCPALLASCVERGKRLASFQNGFPPSRSLGGSYTDSQQREKCPLGGELGCPRHKYLHPSQPDWPVLGWATWDFVEDLRMNRYPSNLHKQALLKSAGVHTVDGEE